MQVSKEIWSQRMDNLNERRKREEIKNSVNGVDDYRAHVNSCYIGRSVLDVGCGKQAIKQCLPAGVEYTGIDPFPIAPNTLKMEIEDCKFEDKTFDTVYAFAMLDNVYDLKKAVDNMKRVCKKNVVILTGVDIDPDQYHTVKIELKTLDELFSGMSRTLTKWLLQDKIALIEYSW